MGDFTSFFNHGLMMKNGDLMIFNGIEWDMTELSSKDVKQLLNMDERGPFIDYPLLTATNNGDFPTVMLCNVKLPEAITFHGSIVGTSHGNIQMRSSNACNRRT